MRARTLICLALLAVGTCRVPPPDTGEEAGTEGLCGGLVGEPGYAAECLTRACVPAEPVVVHSGGDPALMCTGPGGSDSCAATDGYLQQFTYDGDEVYVHLRFSNDIVDSYSTESFRSFFDSGTATLKFDLGADEAQHSFNLDAFDGEYFEGRLELTLRPVVDTVYYMLESSHPDCLSDDIVGICPCYYEIGAELEYRLDLAVQE